MRKINTEINVIQNDNSLKEVSVYYLPKKIHNREEERERWTEIEKNEEKVILTV